MQIYQNPELRKVMFELRNTMEIWVHAFKKDKEIMKEGFD